MQMPSHEFWYDLAGDGPKHYNDMMFRVLRFNGYTHSVQDMYDAWRDDGFPPLAPVV